MSELLHNAEKDAPTCGRCGTYRHLHPTRWCERPRLSFWWDRHALGRHLAGFAWLALSERRRWDFVHWYAKRHPDLCWCDLVDAAYLDLKKGDYRTPHGCLCDVPLPTDAGSPRYGWCYCPPPSTSVLTPEVSDQ